MSLKGAIKNMASKPGEMVKDVGEKANEFFEVQKLKLQAGKIKHDIDDQYKLIGKYYYEKMTEAEEQNEEVAGYFEKIGELQEEFKVTEARIADIKAVWEEEKEAKKAAKAEKNEATECCCCCEECTECDELEEDPESASDEATEE